MNCDTAISLESLIDMVGYRVSGSDCAAIKIGVGTPTEDQDCDDTGYGLLDLLALAIGGSDPVYVRINGLALPPPGVPILGTNILPVTDCASLLTLSEAIRRTIRFDVDGNTVINVVVIDPIACDTTCPSPHALLTRIMASVVVTSTGEYAILAFDGGAVDAQSCADDDATAHPAGTIAQMTLADVSTGGNLFYAWRLVMA